jgi:flagellin-like hook-associated protein FlgL
MTISGFAAMDRAAEASSQLRLRMAELTRQTSGGQRASTYAGLGGEARRAIDLRTEVARHDAMARAAERGQARAAVTQSALSRITTISNDMIAAATSLLSGGATQVSAAAIGARGALREVAGMINERYQGESLFGGADLDGTPIPGRVEDGNLFAAIRGAMKGMAQGGGVALRGALRDLGASNDPAITPFSAYATAAADGAVEDSLASVPVSEGGAVVIGLYPNRNAGAMPSGDPDSTGSWARDLIYGLSVIANLGELGVTDGADYQEVVKGALGALRAGLSGVSDEAAGLGTAEKRLTDSRTRHKDLALQLEGQLSEVEGIDLAEAITRAQATQAQLEASYRSLAMLSSLSLTKFLG